MNERQRKQLEAELASRQKEWHTRHQKLDKLRQDSAIETDTAKKFELKTKIQAKNDKLEQIEQKLAEIEQLLANLVCQLMKQVCKYNIRK